jgi:hypothetical protein
MHLSGQKVLLVPKVIKENMLENIPVESGERKNQLIQQLQESLWTKHPWQFRDARSNEASLKKGVRIQKYFHDPEKLLETAYQDLETFLQAGDIELQGEFNITTEAADIGGNEAFRIVVTPTECRIQAANLEGIRRGIFYIEDEMCRARGAFLPLGTIERSSFLKRRISRCYYGPIKRPGNHPGLGDELIDDIDYYPENYLNRLAHEGVNALWITLSSKGGDETSVGFGDLVSTFLTSDEGAHSKKRLDKLRSVVERCKRYGIRIYLKTMEPHVRFAPDDPRLKQYPDLAGNLVRGYYYLCASGKTGQRYLYEATNKIFTEVPGLGGIINISHGELYTTCLSALPATGGGKITCPRCSKIAPEEILYPSLSAMQRGMQDATPDAEMIGWLYMPQPQMQADNYPNTLADWVYEVPKHIPKGVILQFNFESGIRKTVFGKELIGGDYWLSEAGPSDRFERIAAIAKNHNTSISAKIQTSTSHEVATVPYLPVPTQLYNKFSAMHRLGVTHVMLNWNIGNAPGLMNKAAGELAFTISDRKSTFMRNLASLFWKEKDIAQIVQAWDHFSAGYAHYPLTNLFQYYGPVHSGTTWPLHLKPQDSILSPTYQLGSRNTGEVWPPSGDRIGECFTELLTLEEVVELCHKMSDSWNRGVDILKQLEQDYSDEPERILDIGVAKALAIQFRSGYNILRFYILRDEMLYMKGRERLDELQALVSILQEEIELSEQLAILAEKDARLGYHPDAEGYTYFPEKLRWRKRELQKVLDNDVPEIKQLIEKNELLFPEYTGENPNGEIIYASRKEDESPELNWQTCKYGVGDKTVKCAASYDADSLIIHIKNTSVDKSTFNPESVSVKIEPRRLWPAKHFGESFKLEGNAMHTMRIPFEGIGLSATELHPIRIDVKVQRSDGETTSWRPNIPLLPRLLLGSDNPADLGWLIFR